MGRGKNLNVLYCRKIWILAILGYTGHRLKYPTSKRLLLTGRLRSHYLGQENIKLRTPSKSPVRSKPQLCSFFTWSHGQTKSRGRSSRHFEKPHSSSSRLTSANSKKNLSINFKEVMLLHEHIVDLKVQACSSFVYVLAVGIPSGATSMNHHLQSISLFCISLFLQISTLKRSIQVSISVLGRNNKYATSLVVTNDILTVTESSNQQKISFAGQTAIPLRSELCLLVVSIAVGVEAIDFKPLTRKSEQVAATRGVEIILPQDRFTFSWRASQRTRFAYIQSW